MRPTDTHFKHPSFIRRHEYTVFTNMPRTLARIFQRIWFINSEADMAENLGCAYDSINDFIEWGDIAVADEADMAVLNAFLVQIVSNAEDFMSPHQVACLAALILASYQDGPTRVSTLETAIGELLLWEEEYNPAAKIQKGIREADFAARTASEIARKAAESAEKFRPFIEDDSGDAESRREAAQEVTKAVKLSQKAADIARYLLKANRYERHFFEAERDFLEIHEA